MVINMTNNKTHTIKLHLSGGSPQAKGFRDLVRNKINEVCLSLENRGYNLTWDVEEETEK